MQKFEMEVFLPVKPELLKKELFNMNGVNYELAPILKMSAPEQWASKTITEWPVNNEIFTSTISLFGVIPIDRHRFKLLSINSAGFVESSSSLLNRSGRSTFSGGLPPLSTSDACLGPRNAESCRGPHRLGVM